MTLKFMLSLCQIQKVWEMPKNPINAYKDKGFKDWSDFMGK